MLSYEKRHLTMPFQISAGMPLPASAMRDVPRLGQNILVELSRIDDVIPLGRILRPEGEALPRHGARQVPKGKAIPLPLASLLAFTAVRCAADLVRTARFPPSEYFKGPPPCQNTPTLTLAVFLRLSDLVA